MDIVIVGAGAAGLRTAINLKKYKRDLNIRVLEANPEAGGRMYTYHTKVSGRPIQYDTGAGRIHSSHKLLLDLLKHYDIDTTTLPEATSWRRLGSTTTEPDNFDELWSTLIRLYRELPPALLRTQTLREITIDVMGAQHANALLEAYPYRAEIEIMSGDSSVDLYTSLEAGSFCVPNGGFERLTHCMVKEAKDLGVQFEFNAEVQRIEFKDDQRYHITGLKNKKFKEWTIDRLILAIPVNAMERIYPFSPDHPLLKRIRMEPLMRIYSVYKAKDAAWFPPTRVVTNSPLRYIIPINQKTGLIMSSYLDSRDIEFWHDLHKKDNNKLLKDKIQQETQALFPELTIPKAEITTAHLWRDGCSYWLPGDYDYKKASQQALLPMPQTHPRLHLVGESFSTKQQWIEGALEHATTLVELLKEEYR
jgi:protoporphyrinogen oxidase